LSLYGPRADLPPIALQHVGARWYDPGLGRFVQRDPIGIEGGLNVYAYTANNPVVSVDPEGEYWILLVIAGIAVLLFVKGCANGCNSGTRGANMPRREVLGPKSDTVPDWKTAGGSFGSDDMNEMCVAYRDAASNVPGSGLTGPPMTPDAPGFIVQIWNALINWWNSW